MEARITNERISVAQRARNERAAKYVRQIAVTSSASPEALAVLERRLATPVGVSNAEDYLRRIEAHLASGEFTTTNLNEETSDD